MKKPNKKQTEDGILAELVKMRQNLEFIASLIRKCRFSEDIICGDGNVYTLYEKALGSTL